MKRLTLGIAFAALLTPALPVDAAESRRSGTVVRVAHRRPFVYWRRPWYWGWGYGWYDPFWYGPGYGYGYGYGYGRYAPLRNWAVVDTDVSPESARVFLDGEFLGTADDFDGYPDYLYLRRGRYRLEFRLDGYETRTITVDARPGLKLDVGEKLAKIPGAPRYGSYEDATPPGGVRRFWGKRRDVAEAITGDDEMDEWQRRRPREDRDRDYDERYRGERDRDEDEIEVERDRDRRGDWRGPAAEGGRLRFRVTPPDAAIYLDDRFIGTAGELDDEGGVAVAAGAHTLVVSRPGFRDRRLSLDVSHGEIERVEVTLER